MAQKLFYDAGLRLIKRRRTFFAQRLLKRSAADKSLFEKKGRAIVFNSLEDLSNRIDDPELNVSKNDFLILQNAGPKSVSGMPESGYLPIPKKLLKNGVKDIVRISDARMSGTAFGTVILHVSPESAVGGPLGLVRNGDEIQLSVKERRLDLLVPHEALERRRQEKLNKESEINIPSRGYAKLYFEHVLQAEKINGTVKQLWFLQIYLICQIT